MKPSILIGIDVGKTSTKVGAFAVDGQHLTLVRDDTCFTDCMSVDSIVAGIVHVFNEVSSGFDPKQIIGLGVGTFGVVETSLGVVVSSSSLAFWNQIPLAAMLADKLDFQGPIKILNDVHAAAMGVCAIREDLASNSGILIQLGTNAGVGGFGSLYGQDLLKSPSFG
jgi:predicted NBD/HSP70 family sugar kinase